MKTDDSDARDGGEQDNIETEIKSECLLYGGIKALLRCDEAEVVHGIARYVTAQYPALRISTKYVEYRRKTFISPVICCIGAAVRFLEIRRGGFSDGIIWTARLANERGVIEAALEALSGLNRNELTFHRKPDLSAVVSLFRNLLPAVSHIFRITRKLFRRKQRLEVFQVMRVAELIGYYLHYLKIFREGNYKLALMSSHSNPHGIAFNLAARRCNVPVILTTHGMPVRPVAQLKYDLAIVHCAAAQRTYLEEGTRAKNFLLHGRKQDYLPIRGSVPRAKINVGVFLCKDIIERRVVKLIEMLLDDERVGQILLRPHPKNLWRGFSEWTQSLDSTRVRQSDAEATPAADDLAQVDMIFAGNSSVLIEAVTAGRPGIYVSGIDAGTVDLHRFVESNLIYCFDDEKGFDPAAVYEFYQRPEWPEILRDFANLEETETDVYGQLAAAMRQLMKLSSKA